MTDLLTVAGLVITVLLVYAQIQRQNRASLKLQEEHLKNELRLRVYEDFSSKLQKAEIALSRPLTGYLLAQSTLEQRGATNVPVKPEYSEVLSKAHFRAVRAVNALILHFEKYEMAFERFDTIRSELSSELRLLMDSHSRMSTQIAKYLPLQGLEIPPGTAAVFPLKPSREDLVATRVLVNEYVDRASNLQAFMLDGMIEGQNALLGSLFNRVLPLRSPEDPTVRVLTRDGEMRTSRPKGRQV